MNPEAPKVKSDLAALMARIEGEPIATHLNLKIIEVSPGFAKVSMKMRPEYINFNGMVFGSIIMAAADHALSLAINALVLPSVSSQFNMHFFSPAAAEDELTAECKVLKSGRRMGICEMTVTNQNGKVIAKGTATTIPLADK